MKPEMPRVRLVRNGAVVERTPPASQEDRKAECVRRLTKSEFRKSISTQVSLFLAMVLLWGFPLPNPVKLLVVLVHELSHALAAYATGGAVYGIAIDPGGAGITLGEGGYQPAVVAAGYLGSLVVGGFLYAAGAMWRPNKVWFALCLLCIAASALNWFNSFTAYFSIGALGLLLLGFLLGPEGKKFWLRFLATTSCLYPILDVAGEFYVRNERGFVVRGELVGSDVARFTSLTGLPEGSMVLLWGGLGLLAVVVLIRWSAQIEADAEVRYKLRRPWKIKGLEPPAYDPSRPDQIPEYTVR